MGKRKQGQSNSDNDGMVYSTNPGFQWEDNDMVEDDWSVADCAMLYVSLDRKQRAGKPVTLVEGFDGPPADLLALGKQLKQLCGVGGAVKEGCILVQGDHRTKVISALENWGYSTKQKGG